MERTIPVLRWNCPAEFALQPESIRTAEAASWCAEHLAPLLTDLPEFHPTVVGADFGRTGDLSVVIPLQEQPGPKHRAVCVIELRNTPFEQQRQINHYLCDRLPRFRGGAYDARGNGQYLAEVMAQRYGGNRIHQVMLSEGWYRDNMPPMRAAFEDRSIVLPHDPDVIDDLRALRVERGVARIPDGTRGTGRDGGQRHGDAAIAAALAIFAARNCESGPIEYRSAGRRRGSETETRPGASRMTDRPDHSDDNRGARARGRWGYV
jgi:phage FluMu gp28-like protein